MKLLSGFLLTAMILLVFKRNNWRENGHLVVSAFAVNEIFWSLYFCENIVTCQLVKAGKIFPENKIYIEGEELFLILFLTMSVAFKKQNLPPNVRPSLNVEFTCAELNSRIKCTWDFMSELSKFDRFNLNITLPNLRLKQAKIRLIRFDIWFRGRRISHVPNIMH